MPLNNTPRSTSGLRPSVYELSRYVALPGATRIPERERTSSPASDSCTTSLSRSTSSVRQLIAHAMTSPMIRAFPARLTPAVTRLAALFDEPSGPHPSEGFTVRCDGEALQIPTAFTGPPLPRVSLRRCYPLSSRSRRAG